MGGVGKAEELWKPL